MPRPNAFKKMALPERCPGGGLSHHLGYVSGGEKPEETSNRRNGTRAKTVPIEDGPWQIDSPHGREGCFDPVLIPKHEGCFTGFGDKVFGMYARGMTVREIQGFVTELYGAKVSPEINKSIADAAIADVTARQSRPL